MEHYLAEKYVPGGSAVSLAREAETLRALAAAAKGIRLLQSLYLPGEELCFYVFESETPELVAELSGHVGVDRIMLAVTA